MLPITFKDKTLGGDFHIFNSSCASLAGNGKHLVGTIFAFRVTAGVGSITDLE